MYLYFHLLWKQRSERMSNMTLLMFSFTSYRVRRGGREGCVTVYEQTHAAKFGLVCPICFSELWQEEAFVFEISHQQIRPTIKSVIMWNNLQHVGNESTARKINKRSLVLILLGHGPPPTPCGHICFFLNHIFVLLLKFHFQHIHTWVFYTNRCCYVKHIH